MEFLSNSIPVLISFCFVSLGFPFFCFCDSEDRDGGDKTGAGPQEEGPSASAAGPSSRVEGLNRFPDIRERERELVGEDFSPSGPAGSPFSSDSWIENFYGEKAGPSTARAPSFREADHEPSTSASGGSGTRSPVEGLPDLPDDSLSLIKAQISNRLLREEVSKEEGEQYYKNTVFDEDLELRIELKLQILNEVKNFHPGDSFWEDHKTEIVSDGLTNRKGNEFPLEELKRKLDDVRTRGPDSPVYKEFLRYQRSLLLSDGRSLYL